jgi:hypothetical protein
MEELVVFTIFAIIVVTAVLLTFPFQSDIHDKPILTTLGHTRTYVIGGADEDLFDLSNQKKISREQQDEYDTYRSIADREEREKERDTAFEEWAEEERELRELLSEQRLRD